jgi:hypothetical protein
MNNFQYVYENRDKNYGIHDWLNTVSSHKIAIITLSGLYYKFIESPQCQIKTMLTMHISSFTTYLVPTRFQIGIYDNW